jgi:hypothetical protein
MVQEQNRAASGLSEAGMGKLLRTLNKSSIPPSADR